MCPNGRLSSLLARNFPCFYDMNSGLGHRNRLAGRGPGRLASARRLLVALRHHFRGALEVPVVVNDRLAVRIANDEVVTRGQGSDVRGHEVLEHADVSGLARCRQFADELPIVPDLEGGREIGRASCRERV